MYLNANKEQDIPNIYFKGKKKGLAKNEIY
jgi:hypothetical protein